MTLTVYQVRGKGKRYQSLRWAYYNAAKEMIVAKYPKVNSKGGIEYYEQHPKREDKKIRYFGQEEYTDYWGEDKYDWDHDAWIMMITRLARFLRFVDRHEVHGPCPNCHGELHTAMDGDKIVGVGCNSCGAMYDSGTKL
jgi:hypothetical protein